MGMRAIAGKMLEGAGLAEPSGGLRILDAGCGTGRMLSWLGRYGGAGRTVGVDVSWYALQFCRQRRHRLLSQASIAQLPFRSDYFDLVTCSDVLQHLPHDAEAAALAELQRVLKPGRLLYLRTNARGLFECGRADVAEPDFRKYDRDRLAEALRTAGFVIERATYANSLLSLLADIRRWLRPVTDPHAGGQYTGLSIKVPASAWLNRMLFFVLTCEARFLAKPARALPFGHTLICLGRKPEHGQAP
jgi:ubiquinone/menaquinone biosynthesis C-methylase UbiE